MGKTLGKIVTIIVVVILMGAFIALKPSMAANKARRQIRPAAVVSLPIMTGRH